MTKPPIKDIMLPNSLSKPLRFVKSLLQYNKTIQTTWIEDLVLMGDSAMLRESDDDGDKRFFFLLKYFP